MGYYKQLSVSLRGELEDIDEPPLSELGELQYVVKDVLSITELADFDDYQLGLHGRREGETYSVYSSEGRLFATAGFDSEATMGKLSDAAWVHVPSWFEYQDPADIRRRVIAGSVFAHTSYRREA